MNRRRIPAAPADWPSPARITTLFAVASAVESRTQTHRRLRQFLELPADVRITESLLMEKMGWEDYLVLVTAYAEQLTKGARTARRDAATPGEEEVS